MANSSILVLFALGLAYCTATYQLTTECPSVEESEMAVCVSTCDVFHECEVNQWCCPNACGGTSCATVQAPCTVNGTVYQHHQDMEPLSDPDNNICGFCWCQNGQQECFEHSCDGTGPIP